jgi:hypothetical protein
MTSTTFTVNHTAQEHVAVNVQSKASWLFPFRPLGKLPMHSKPDHVDALAEICKFSKAELFLLDIVREHLEPNNFIKITKAKYTQSVQQKVSLAISTWIKKGLIKRVKREQYLVNPYFLVPALDKQDLVKKHWETL